MVEARTTRIPARALTVVFGLILVAALGAHSPLGLEPRASRPKGSRRKNSSPA